MQPEGAILEWAQKTVDLKGGGLLYACSCSISALGADMAVVTGLRRAGLKTIHIMRNVEDPSEVVLFFEAKTIEGAKGFVFSPEVPQSKEQSGVVDKPDIYFLT